MELVINIKIPKKIIREMDVYRKKYHPSKLSHSHAHITLVPPFVLKGKLSDLVEDIRSILRSQVSFWISINGLGSFGDDVLFFKPNCPIQLKNLRLIFKKLVRENYRKQGHDKYWRIKAYRPHITIAHDKPENIRKYKKELKGLKYRKRFKVVGIGLYVRRKDKRWILKKEFLFGRVD